MPSQCDRNEVLKKSHMLKGRGQQVFIYEDLCASSQEIVKSLLPERKAAKENGFVAYFRGTRLIKYQRKATDSAPASSETAAARSPPSGGRTKGDAPPGRGRGGGGRGRSGTRSSNSSPPRLSTSEHHADEDRNETNIETTEENIGRNEQSVVEDAPSDRKTRQRSNTKVNN